MHVYLAKVGLCSFLHFVENHGWDFFSRECLLLPFVVDFDFWFSSIVDDSERPVFHVGLHRCIVELPANQSLSIYNEKPESICYSMTMNISRHTTCLAIVQDLYLWLLLTEDCVGWVHCNLVFGSISDQPFGVCECNITRGSSVSLVICDDLNFAVLEHSYTRVCGSQIDPNGLCLFAHVARKKSLCQQNQESCMLQNYIHSCGLYSISFFRNFVNTLLLLEIYHC